MPHKDTAARPSRPTGESHPWWKGGRSVASNGYVLIRVGKAHPLADVRGYAYEHRIVAQEKIGRPLREGEIVHHVNGDKQDNRAENLEVVFGNAEHFVHHRGAASRLRMPGEPNPDVPCACGCGVVFPKFDDSGRPRSHVSGHNHHPSPTMDLIADILRRFGPMRTFEIISMSALSKSAAAVALSKLKRSGILVNPTRGTWAIARKGG